MASILSQKKAYSAYYGDFRGVDFSSDHTQVLNQRLAYSKNMYKDYQSGEGKAIETIPGFRRRFQAPDNAPIRGVFDVRFRNGEEHILVHAGSLLYKWESFPRTANIDLETVMVLPESTGVTNGLRTFRIDLTGIAPAAVTSVKKPDGAELDPILFTLSGYELKVQSNELLDGDTVTVVYRETIIAAKDAIFSTMANTESNAFVFGDRLYLIDGTNYLVYDGNGIHPVADDAYVPTTYIDIVPGGAAESAGHEYEQRNLLTPKFKSTFISDGTTKEYCLNEQGLETDITVEAYGTVLSSEAYTYDSAIGKITFKDGNVPKKPEDAGYPENYAGVIVTAKKVFQDPATVQGCTLTAVFDERPFFAGNPLYPCRIYYCGRNAKTGLVDPTYIPMLHRVEAGTTNVPVRALVPVADTLMALKGDTQQDGSVYYFSPVLTDDNVVPVIYQSVRGLAGIGCLGAACNFLDDPVFVSRLGLEAVGQLSTRLERAIEHRSSLVDAKLCNLPLETARLTEWNGYLWLLCDGKVFLADSRQRFSHESGVMQYEWYYLEDIGVYRNQYDEYRFAARMYDEIVDTVVHYVDDEGDEHTLTLELAETPDEVANPSLPSGQPAVRVYTEMVGDNRYAVDYVVSKSEDGLHAYLVTFRGGKTGGAYHPATALFNVRENVFFGTGDGALCSFNFDKRDGGGEIAPAWYTFDDRPIRCGCATKMDNCGIPGMTKTTVKKSTVIKTKAFAVAAAKVKVRTNQKPYEQISRIGTSRFSFDSMDFLDFSFTDESESLYAVKEKEKKWVEKQYYLYSDEYMRPFALYYITFRYTVAGRYKQ